MDNGRLLVYIGIGKIEVVNVTPFIRVSVVPVDSSGRMITSFVKLEDFWKLFLCRDEKCSQSYIVKAVGKESTKEVVIKLANDGVEVIAGIVRKKIKGVEACFPVPCISGETVGIAVVCVDSSGKPTPITLKVSGVVAKHANSNCIGTALSALLPEPNELSACTFYKHYSGVYIIDEKLIRQVDSNNAFVIASPLPELFQSSPSPPSSQD